MDIGLDVDTTSHWRRTSTLTSPTLASTHSASVPSSSPSSVFSYNCQSGQRSATASSVSSVGENIQNEEDAAYYSDSEARDATVLGAPAGQEEQLDRHGSFPYPVSHDTYGQDVANPQTISQENVTHWARASGPPGPASDLPLPLSRRQNPRRTQRTSQVATRGPGLREARHPPQLVRQSERKDSFVESLVDTTTQTIETIWPLSVAHGRASANQNLLGLRTFVQEVLRRSRTSYSTLLVGIYYLIVVMPDVPKIDFTMEQQVDDDGLRAMQCGRRMFLAALILASKYLQDRNYSAHAWSKISGLQVAEINLNERAFLNAVGWKLHVPEAVFNRWERIVLRYSPSSNSPIVPRSSPATHQTWRCIIHQLNADLDQFDIRGKLMSDGDSGYHSGSSAPSSRETSPHAPRLSSTTQVAEASAIPLYLHPLPPLTLEPRPQESKSDHRMLPPLQPREGPLPTPQITPQIRSFYTPAVSASGLLPRRPSMSMAMNEHRKCLEESLLDRANSWQSRSDSIPRHFNHVPSSLSNYSSSPDFAYPSRSSSVSSVASANCALLEPSMATGAMRRCANTKLSAWVDNQQASLAGDTTFPKFPTPETYGSDFYFKDRPKRLADTVQHDQRIRATAVTSISLPSSQDSTLAYQEPSASSSEADSPWSAASFASSRSSLVEDDDTTPKPCAAGIKVIPSLNSQTFEAAAALVDLTLDRTSTSGSSRTPTGGDSRKRARPLSIDFGLHNSVRAQALEEGTGLDNDSAIVIPDDEAVADTWLLKGGNGSSYNKQDELWATFDRNESDNRWNSRAAMTARSMPNSCESLPRKKACVSPRGRESGMTAKQGLSERAGGGNTMPRKTSGQSNKTKSRGPRKPAAEMDHMLRDAQADYAEMQNPSSSNGRLLYGEVGSW